MPLFLNWGTRDLQLAPNSNPVVFINTLLISSVFIIVFKIRSDFTSMGFQVVIIGQNKNSIGK